MLQTCPVDLEEFFCREFNYSAVDYLAALAKKNVFLYKDTTVFVFLDYAIDGIDYSDRLSYFLYSRLLSIVGVGYQDGNFTTNSFWVTVIDKLEKINSKKVPKIFALRFFENRFEAVVRVQIEESRLVWVPLGKNYCNTTLVEGLWTKSERGNVQLLGKTEMPFNTCSNVFSLPQKDFTGFKKGAEKVMRKRLGVLLKKIDILAMCFTSAPLVTSRWKHNSSSKQALSWF